MAGNLLQSGADALLRGEQVRVCHVLHVPKSRDLFGSPRRAHWRATVVWPDGRWANNILVTELHPIDA